MILTSSLPATSFIMAPSVQETTSPLGKLAGSIGLLAIALFFAGWIYRWHYFTYFQVEPTNLGLSIESNYIVAFSLLFRSPWVIARALASLALAVVGITLTFKAINTCQKMLGPQMGRMGQKIGLSSNQWQQLRLLGSLFDELVIVLWVMLLLYGLARGQGLADARRDAVNETTTLPAISIAMNGKEAVIGRDLDQLLTNPNSVRLFGSRERYDALLGAELNPDDRRTTWRLLSDAGGQLLVFPSLPEAEINGKAPPVLVFPDHGKGDQLIILSPAQTP